MDLKLDIFCRSLQSGACLERSKMNFKNSSSVLNCFGCLLTVKDNVETLLICMKQSIDGSHISFVTVTHSYFSNNVETFSIELSDCVEVIQMLNLKTFKK